MKTRTIIAGIMMLAASSTFMSCSTGRCPMSFAKNYKAPEGKSIIVEQKAAPVAAEKINLDSSN